MNALERRLFEHDLACCIRLADQRKRENAAARERVLNNAELVALLETSALRAGRVHDWSEYFRGLGLGES